METQTFASFIPLIIVTLAFSAIAEYLLRQKGYSGALRILAWIPLINAYAMLLIVGLPDKKLHDKIDALLRHYERKGAPDETHKSHEIGPVNRRERG